MSVREAHVGGNNKLENYSKIKSISFFSIAEYHYEENKPTINAFSHQHTEYEFIIPIKTTPLLIYEKASYIGEVGYTYPVNPNVVHGIDFALDKSEIIDITIDMDYFDDIKKELGYDKKYFYTRFPVSLSFIKLCYSFLNSDNNQFRDENMANIIITSLINDGLYDSSDRRRPEKVYAKNVKNIIFYMYENYKDSNLTINKLSQLSGYSTAYFTKAFKAYMHDSPIVHLNKLRISEAKSLMFNEPTLNFKEIAEKVGYSNLSTFTESFKRVTGFLPKDYKNRYI